MFLYGPEFALVETRMCTLSHGLGVSTFLWGSVTDMRENELPLAIVRPEGRGPANYLGLV
ncbi:hypothetical protein CRG98_049680, partial [Punica granatum]